MAFVEPQYPEFCWAADLQIERTEDCLLIGGYRGFPRTEEQNPSSDLWAEYRKAPKDWSSKHTGKKLPHIRFANADTDEKLISFVRQFGPMTVRSLGPGQLTSGERDYSVIVAEQDLKELRDERILYYRALSLLSELKEKEEPDHEQIVRCMQAIAAKAQVWPQQWDREQRLRKGTGTEPGWRFHKPELDHIETCLWHAEQKLPTEQDELVVVSSVLSDPVTAGHYTLCELVNAFRLRVYHWGDRVIEGPDTDLNYGIRPLLYLILRRAYLEGGIAVCANEKCREVFEIERAGNRFCGENCSQLQRQREYWAARGKKLRTRRRKDERAAKHRAERKLSKRDRDSGKDGADRKASPKLLRATRNNSYEPI